MKTFQHQQSSHLSGSHPRQTGPVVSVTHPELPLKRKKTSVQQLSITDEGGLERNRERETEREKQTRNPKNMSYRQNKSM